MNRREIEDYPVIRSCTGLVIFLACLAAIAALAFIGRMGAYP